MILYHDIFIYFLKHILIEMGFSSFIYIFKRNISLFKNKQKSFFIEFSDKLSNQNLFLRFLKRFKSECVVPEIIFRNAFLGFIWHTDTLCIYCKLFLVKLKNQPENVIIPWLGKKLCIVKSCALALLWNDLIMRVKSRNCIKLHH